MLNLRIIKEGIYTCTSVYILHDSKTSLIYQIKSSTAVRFILHKTHFVCNTPFNYNVLINPYIKNHFKYINIYCLSFNFRKMYQLMLLVGQNFTVLLNPIALFNKCNSYTYMSKFKHSVTLLQNSC